MTLSPSSIMPKSPIARPTWWRRRLASLLCSRAAFWPGAVRRTGSDRGRIVLMNPPFYRPCVARDRRCRPRRGACKLAGVEPANDAVMNQQLVELKLEHRALDLAIARLQADIPAAELTLKDPQSTRLTSRN